MTMEQADRQEAGRRARRAALVLALVLAGLHFVCVMRYFEPATSARDAQSYYAQARRLADTHRPYVETESLVQYVGFHWMHAGANRYYSKYPPGLPFVLAVVCRVFGPQAMLWVNPLMASLMLVGVFLICREWAGPGWGFAGMALMGTTPLVNYHALYGDSHIASAFFLVWAVFLLVAWARARRAWLLVAAGLLAGFIPSIRYSEVLFLPALGLFALLESRGKKDIARNALLFAAGAAVPVAALSIFNHAAFGAFWKTGYGAEAGAFGWEYFRQSYTAYAQSMLSEGGAYVFVLGVFGVSGLCAHRAHWRRGVLLAGLIMPVTLMYMCFFVAPYAPVRYLLPTLPLYAAGAVWFLKELAGDRRAAAIATGAVIVLLTAYWGLPQARQELGPLQTRHRGLALAGSMLEAHVPRGSILIADEGICQQLDSLGYWRLAEESILLRRGRPPQAPTGTFEPEQKITARHAAQMARYGKLPPLQMLAAFEEDVRAWAGASRQVYWVTTEQRMLSYTGGDARAWGLVPLRELHIPLPAARPRRHVFMPPPQGAQADARFQLTRPGVTLVLYQWALND